MKHDESRTIEKFIELSGIIPAPFSLDLTWEKGEKNINNQSNQNTPTVEIISLTGSQEEELFLIENEVKK